MNQRNQMNGINGFNGMNGIAGARQNIPSVVLTFPLALLYLPSVGDKIEGENIYF